MPMVAARLVVPIDSDAAANPLRILPARSGRAVSSSRRQTSSRRAGMGRVTILDGGMGRELQRVGAPFRQPEWSALALIESPLHVTMVHEEYAQAGVNVITTNTYALVPFHIGEERFDREGRRLAALAGLLAREVADAHPDVRVAGCLPPVLGSYLPERFVADEARPLVEVLVEEQAPFVDLWLAETQSSIG